MVPRKRSAAMKVVPIMLREVEYVGDMGQSEPFRHADMKDVPTMQRREEFASDMVQKLRIRLAIMKDAHESSCQGRGMLETWSQARM